MLHIHNNALRLADQFAADGQSAFTFQDAVERTGLSRPATANLLRRMADNGLVDRVRRGLYVTRQLGVLGTTAAAEDLALAVGVAFNGQEHRIAYRSALYEHGLITHPSRSIQVAATRRTRVAMLSGRPLRVVIEPQYMIQEGSTPLGLSMVSDLERTLLDAAARPDLVGGPAALAEALVSAGRRISPKKLQRYAKRLQLAPALRRLGSVADQLDIQGLAGQLAPILPPKGDINLEPRDPGPTGWRDSVWRVRWNQLPSELANVARQ
ncbi:MAG: type IV toxin-antitoxin system AbiEi family antitoxin domain-containing protein [Chloroflexi bacterium]|nr:type IV toxin-antitoxin system AbiEi family antitoxin domain-containing protein [Chloroflexota bacterium]